MKKLLSLLLIILSVQIFGQDVEASSDVPYYHDSLTVSVDTIDVDFIPLDNLVSNSISAFTISIYTISGTDTVKVFTQSADELIWSQKAVTDLSTYGTDTIIAVTTTPKEFTISEIKPDKIRIISTSDDGSVSVFSVSGKKGVY